MPAPSRANDLLRSQRVAWRSTTHFLQREKGVHSAIQLQKAAAKAMTSLLHISAFHALCGIVQRTQAVLACVCPVHVAALVSQRRCGVFRLL